MQQRGQHLGRHFALREVAHARQQPALIRAAKQSLPAQAGVWMVGTIGRLAQHQRGHIEHRRRVEAPFVLQITRVARRMALPVAV